MNLTDQLKAEFANLAAQLGDTEFQIYILIEKRDKIRHSMQILDQNATKLQQFSTNEVHASASLIKESYEKKIKALQDSKSQSSDRAPSVTLIARPDSGEGSPNGEGA